MRSVPSSLPLLCLLGGCYLSHGPPQDAGEPDGGHLDAGWDAGVDGGRPDAGFDAGPPDAGFDGGVPDAAVDAFCEGGVVPGDVSDLALDLLFVVDSSGSMSEEQLSLTEQFPRMVRVLGSGDLDGDGREDFAPVRSMHIGVVTTDLGALTANRYCDRFGDDGILRTERGLPDRRCRSEYPEFLRFSPGGDEPLDELARDFSCVARVGTSGCFVEQPLEAALKALTPATSELRFAHGRVGHGDGDNAGFLREDSILGIVLVTDEDDCSIEDPDLWSFESATYTGLHRCTDYEDEALHDVSRYVDGFRALRDDGERLVVAAVAGVPEDLVADPDAIDYDRLLADERMQIRPSPIFEDQILPACAVPLRGQATPARRLARVVREFGDTGVIQSICQDSFEGALLAIIERLGRAIRMLECGE